MSASLIYAQQSVGGRHQIPLFNRKTSGIIFRPGVTKISCGKAVDSAGTCGGWCSDARLRYGWSETSDKLCAWRPKNVGLELQRVNTYGKSRNWLQYNEFVLPSAWWSAHMPDMVEAIFGDQQVHEAFLRRYRLSTATHPFVNINLDDWRNPIH